MFGSLWGFPPGPPVTRTLDWLLTDARGYGGGMRYFEGNDYGGDLFFFTTSGAAEVLAGQGRIDQARELDVTTSTWNVLYPTLVRGVGLGLLLTPVMTAAINAVPMRTAGMA